MNYDYESLGEASMMPLRLPVLEDYTGVQIVGWYGKVGTEMRKKRDHYERSGNRPLADKLSAFLRTWENNPVTGSINRETLEMYKAASLVLGNDTNHDIGSFFRALTTEIDKVIAQTEQLPPAEGDSTATPTGRAGKSFSSGPLTSFGGEEGPPVPEPEGGPAEPEGGPEAPQGNEPGGPDTPDEEPGPPPPGI